MQKLFFLSGLPRSGSTLMAALLAQNPKTFVSMTSPLLEFLGVTEQAWHRVYQNFTCPFEGHLNEISKGLIAGFYKQVEQPYVIDKSRGWSANVDKIKEVIDQDSKLICTVRDLPSVVASFYRLIDLEKKGESNIDRSLIENGLAINSENRCQAIWQNLVRGSWNSFKVGYQNHRQSIHLVEYDELISDPAAEMQKIYDFLQIENFEHDFNKITAPLVEDDSKWGIKNLHKIASKLERQSKTPQEILGEENYHKYRDLRLEFWR